MQQFKECKWCNGTGKEDGHYPCFGGCEGTGLEGGRAAAEAMDKEIEEAYQKSLKDNRKER